MSVIHDFLRDLDRRWSSPRHKIRLSVIGSAALMLQTSYTRGTKDSDILQTAAITDEVKADLLSLAGMSSALHTRHKVYLEVVPGGLPFLPQRPLYHAYVDPNGALEHFEIELLDIVDVVVSKLFRFSPNDRDDIRAMVDMGRVDHARLLERFRSAVDAFSMDARASQLPRCVLNLHRVERDFLFVDASEIVIPDT